MGAAVEQRLGLDDERQLVIAMSSFTEQERSEILAESRRLLRPHSKADKPAPAPEPPPRVFEPEDAVRKWCREAEEREQERADAKAAMRQQERETARADWSAWTAHIDERIEAALASHIGKLWDGIYDAAERALETSEAIEKIDKKLAELQVLLTKLHTGENLMRAREGHAPLDLPPIRRTN